MTLSFLGLEVSLRLNWFEWFRWIWSVLLWSDLLSFLVSHLVLFFSGGLLRMWWQMWYFVFISEGFVSEIEGNGERNKEIKEIKINK